MEFPTTDAQVLRSCGDDPSAFAELYERHSEVVIRFVARRVGPVAAEDLAAEVFVRAFRGRDSCRCEYGSALPWLLGVATHVIADHRRVEKRRFEALEKWASETPGTVVHEHAGLTPELVHELRRLPEKDRDALLLVVWGELSYLETATALGVPVGTVRSRVARARQRLSTALGQRKQASFAELGANGGANA
jgi:RNA polymerase sigma-70 factor (ECF subfamily)